MSIKVLPPWWKSNWFFMIIGICCASGIYVAYLVITERMRTLHQLKMERLQREFTTNKLNLERIEREKMDSINQMKTDFFTNISHEFRTPLTLIISPLEELIHHEVSDKTTKKYHELMLQNTKRLYHLVDQILEFRKTEAGTRKLQISQGDVVDFVREIYDSFMTLAEKRTINYVFHAGESQLSSFFDRESIERICFNLLSNAFKYTPIGGNITISVAKEEEDLIIKVLDSGIGIANDEQEDIFERFYQVDSKEMNLGSGIGLAFTKKLVELHHGSIYLESEIGKGSVFTVRIPISEKSYELEEFLENQLVIDDSPVFGPEFHVEKDETQEIRADVLDRESLLIVDDNQEIVDYLQHYFGKQYNIKVAFNGKEALALLEEEAFDLIISDVMMPEIDGIQLSKKIKQNITTCHIPIILLTAKSETVHQIKGLEAGADDYVAKPFSIALLDAKVQNILKSRKRLKEYFSSTKEIVPENIAFNPLDEAFLRQAITIIESHIGNSDFSVDMFSREIGMSRSNLYLKLKAITGESATDFVRRIRFNKATELLETRQYTVAQVAYMCGFNSPSYFSTAFKQYHGYMPTEYLEKKESGLN